jgi:mono/diheme cytochrome c family protein
LFFKHDGKTTRTLIRKELVAAIKPETWRAYDPYYNGKKHFRALPLRAVLKLGFPGVKLAEQHFILEARDGYKVPISGKRLLEDGAYIAIEDLEVPGWEPIGPQQANPGPYYVVWRKPTQHDLKTHPRPWQLSVIAISPFEKSYPHTIPTSAGADAQAGFAIFREQCLRCHAINREGGRVGPELNVPKSVVEYRPIAQIRAYIKDPLRFRYGNMPANPHLSEKDLDHLVAYFRAMSERKHDPKGNKSAH